MRNQKWAALVLLVGLLSPVVGNVADAAPNDNVPAAQQDIRNIESQQNAYVKEKGPAFFEQLAKGQSPGTTVVMCSDSRGQTNMLSNNPEGRLFVIRNIGNQLITSLGSVDYGVNQLHSVLLLIIGHSNCGAIAAASSGKYDGLAPSIVKEVKSLKMPKGISNIDGVELNVNNQVKLAMKEFAPRIKKQQLLVVGAVYDFSDDLKQGSGKLIIINVNGEMNPAKIDKMQSLLHFINNAHQASL